MSTDQTFTFGVSLAQLQRAREIVVTRRFGVSDELAERIARAVAEGMAEEYARGLKEGTQSAVPANDR
jgi:hypothetical protein